MENFNISLIIIIIILIIILIYFLCYNKKKEYNTSYDHCHYYDFDNNSQGCNNDQYCTFVLPDLKCVPK